MSGRGDGGFWTQERDAELVRLWGERRSHAEMAQALGASKGAVAGRIHRLRARGGDVPVREEFWTEERDGELVRLFKDGLSQAKIADALGAASKDAVAGRIERLRKRGVDIPPRKRKAVTPLGPTKPHRSPGLNFHGGVRPSSAGKPLPRTGPRPDEPAPLNLTLLQLGPRNCRWPVNDGGPFRFCGARTAGGGMKYCPYHHELAHGRKAA